MVCSIGSTISLAFFVIMGSNAYDSWSLRWTVLFGIACPRKPACESKLRIRDGVLE